MAGAAPKGVWPRWPKAGLQRLMTWTGAARTLGDVDRAVLLSALKRIIASSWRCSTSEEGSPMIKQLALLAMLLLGGTAVMAQDRMPEISADQMTEAQKQAASEFAEGRGYAVRGPFAAMLRSPEVMLRAKAMGDYVRFKSTIPARLNELAIIITARQWSQNYEWQAHRPLAEKAGLRSEIAQAIADGHRPIGMSADEEIVYDFSMELHANKSVSEDRKSVVQGKRAELVSGRRCTENKRK